MVKNDAMIKYFLHKGGLDAVYKLLRESKDFDVLKCCALSLIQASKHPDNCKFLVDKNIFSAIATLIDVFVTPAGIGATSQTQYPHKGEKQRDSLSNVTDVEKQDTMRHLTACILANLTVTEDRGLDEILVLNNIVNIVQTLSSQLNRIDTICMLMMTLCNICPAVLGPDAESTIRICFQSTKKIDVSKNVTKALFVVDVYNNFSRINHYSSLLVDEGLMPLLLHMIDLHSGVDDILKKCTEALANLSINRKNRREIASSGIASRLTLLFEKGSPTTRAYSLLIMGNLLSSGLFYDKVANENTISYILENLLQKNYPKQFAAVSYCLSQLSKVEHSCEVLVKCDVVPILLGYLREAPPESLDNLWMVLVNISKHSLFFNAVMKEVRPLIVELFEEVKSETCSLHQRQCVVQICLNLSRQRDFGNHLDITFIQKFIKTLKLLFASKQSPSAVQHFCLVALTNFAHYCEPARSSTLDNDLMDLFQENGFADSHLNVKYAALINIISNDESCIYRLIEQGAQKLLVSLQDSFSKLSLKENIETVSLKKKDFKKGQSIVQLKELIKSGAFQFLSGDDNANDSLTNTATSSTNGSATNAANAEMAAQLSEGELGKELSAASFHNLAIKRPVLSPGVLVSLLSLARNTKTRRVLHCVRSLANMSVHPKSKVALNKEGRRIIPLLTVTMRTGCVEAEKVQHYCALTLCNIMAAPMDKAVFTDLIKTGTIVDLVVVTLLRINSNVTKEMLGKTLFNILSRPDIRETLVVQLDLLAAILELCKVEFLNLLELCIRILFNITCELSPSIAHSETYAKKLIALKVPHILVGRLVHNVKISGSKTNKPIRTLLGMAIANMSFHKTLVIELAQQQAAIADAMVRVYALGCEEGMFSAMVTLFNISQIVECNTLAGTKAVNLIVEALEKGKDNPVLVTKLCIGTLCNFSNIPVFQEQLTDVAIPSIVGIISAPHLHGSIKRDAIQTMYNLANMYKRAKNVFITNDAIVALWKLLKVQGSGGGAASSSVVDASSSSVGGSETLADASGTSDEETTLLLIGHIVKALCDEAGESGGQLHKRAMTDGIMNILLKLSKIELPVLKLDMSFAMYSMVKSDSGDIIKVLKADSVDILFWLTIYDTLNIHDTILKNVSRSLRCFSSSPESCKLLVKQERFFSVIKALIKSKNEDVLWQTAAVLYNLMMIDTCTKILLEKGLISYIFDLAASNYDSVRHVCSACLHLIPNNMPSMDDPVVLQLVLCLLEADGDRFAQLGEKPTDVLPYNTMVLKCYAGSLFKHDSTGFSGAWNVLTCGVDAAFYPAMIFEPDDVNIEIGTSTKGGESGSPVNGFENHEKILSSTYNDFQRDVAAGAASTMIGSGDIAGVTLATPALSSKAPPGYDSNATRKSSYAVKGNEFSDSSNFLLDRSTDQLSDSKQFKTTSKSSNKLPLIQPPKSLPENTLDAINKSIAKQAKSHAQLLSSSLGEAPTTGKGLPVSVLKSASEHPFVSLNQYGNNFGK
eukprot:CAMPEP_0170120348 /NCGR_PEP_ID=MMETSP0020_2-20130122/15090_1 /TAXON_ID=98059 /ORGANISM="Dinobryon sp., Strain UTEXLB2267" /LENGTH=1500 /DNA_ID=CAMNT_0010350197 /DNA_START=432 /DNA_END=4934 /DNA_ORIENTATION=+